MKTLRLIANDVAREERGFTLIELLAVMAIVATLAAIVSTSVSGTGNTSVNTAAQQDATTVNSAAAEFFSDQAGASVITPHSVTVLAAMADSDTTFDSPPTVDDPVTQNISSRWPEKFITAGDSPPTEGSAYGVEFPTSLPGNGQGGDVVNVTIRAKSTQDGEPGDVITRQDLLTQYTAIDFDKLVSGITVGTETFLGGYSEQQPDTLTQKSGGFHSFLWLFNKGTSAGGSGEDDSRVITVFKLISIQVIEFDGPIGLFDAGDVELTYKQIF